MRDAQSKLDQVIAFTGGRSRSKTSARCSAWSAAICCSTRCRRSPTRMRRRRSRWPAARSKLGYDLRARVPRAVARGARSAGPLDRSARINDPEIAGEGDRERLKELPARFSREDLLRSFDRPDAGGSEIRVAAQPRYHLEMALLRWIHLRKLMPIEDLIAGGWRRAGAARAPPRRCAAVPASAPATARAGPAAAAAASRPRPVRLRRAAGAVSAVRLTPCCRAPVAASDGSRCARCPATSRTRCSRKCANGKRCSTTWSSRRRRRSTSTADRVTFTFRRPTDAA